MGMAAGGAGGAAMEPPQPATQQTAKRAATRVGIPVHTVNYLRSISAPKLSKDWAMRRAWTPSGRGNMSKKTWFFFIFPNETAADLLNNCN
jgi:hypothetical protein